MSGESNRARNQAPNDYAASNGAQSYWLELMSELNLSKTKWEPFWRNLEGLYAEPHRKYHNLNHIGHFLDTLFKLNRGPSQAQRIAAFFHDAVYDPTRKDNERKSADLAADFFGAAGLSEQLGQSVELLIMATVSHDYPGAVSNLKALPEVPLSQEEIAEFLDSDLAILGSAPEAYSKYCGSIAQEYSHVPPLAFAIGRAQFLRRFVSSEEPLFHSAMGSRLFESIARENLKRELSEIAGPSAAS